MADTSLILHVKGTESETAVLPKNVVRAGISEGKITHSQLIWIPNENTWKPVKELPDLLPGERLILHVKGTEAETQELPKTEVRAAVLQGKITHSQLIWVPGEHTWKAVRELPDLLPGETLILHVKGTEAQTQELPKKAVQSGVSKGQITHSQLIWIPNESTWKPVRELPELLPGERHILHVKGTEAETTELPRRAIKTAISKGEMTHSQLIWSPNEHAWKQVREIPELLPTQKLAPAPSRETLLATPRIVDGIIPDSPSNPVARAVAASGDIPQVRVAASAASAMHVAGSPPKVIPKAATAGTPVRVGEAVPVVKALPIVAQAAPVVAGVPVAGVPQVRAATVVPALKAPQLRVPGAVPTAGVPQVRAAATVPAVGATPVRAGAVPATAGAAPKAATTIRANSPTKTQTQVKTPAPATGPVDHSVKEKDDQHPLKWLCIGLGAVIAVLMVVNYFMVDMPLTSELAKTRYSDVGVYGHLGAFMQPSVMVIHIPASATVTPETLTDFLVNLAHSTPNSPLSGEPFARIALTSGWTAQYSFSGYSWKELGDMANASDNERKDEILIRMGDAAGQPLIESTLNEQAQAAQRQIIWAAFVNKFAK